MPLQLPEFRFALRQLRKNPGFTATTLLTLALGIGATTAIFSLVNAVVLRPLPFPEPDRLIWTEKADTSHGPAINEPISYPDFFDWREQAHSLSGIACYRSGGFTLTGRGEAQLLNGEVVSADFFRVLGVRPALGRDFRREEEKPGAHVVVLSHQLWQSFGSPIDIVGQTIMLNGANYVVTGVAPAGFVYPIESREPVLWTTLAEDARGENPQTTQRGNDRLKAIGRLKPGVPIAQARAELNLIARNLSIQYPE